MTRRAPGATIHHVPGRRPAQYSRRHGRPGPLDVPDALGKLDRALEILTDVQVMLGQTVIRLDGLGAGHDRNVTELAAQRDLLTDVRDRVTSLEHAPDYDRAIEQIEGRYDRTIEQIEGRLTAVEARPPGVTGRQLLAALAGVVATLAGLVAVAAFALDHIRIT